MLIKPNQAGTVTETKAALDAAHAGGWNTIVSARSGESEDVSIVHLAVGWGAGQLKVGSFSRSERMAKWNEGLRIAEAIGDAHAAAALGLPLGTPPDRSRRGEDPVGERVATHPGRTAGHRNVPSNSTGPEILATSVLPHATRPPRRPHP